MRIISGKNKGKKLYTQKNKRIRPTSDKVKEAIFNILGNVNDAHILDLFCGSGNLGIEALSRGANSGTFIDKDKRAVQLAKKNIENCNYQDRAEIVCKDVFKWITQSTERSSKKNHYQIIFADPPYEQGYSNKLIIDSDLNYLIDKQGLLVIESSINELQNEIIHETHSVPWEIITVKNYGKTKIVILKLDRSEMV